VSGPRLVVILLLSVALAACAETDDRDAPEAPSAPARQVSTVTVGERPFERVVAVTGTLAAEEQVVLAFKVAGQVGEVNVDLGSPVTRGQVLARLIPTDFELRLGQAEAALAQARARLGLSPDGEGDGGVDPENTPLARQRRAMLNEARLNRDRTKTFVDRGISPRASLDSAEAAVEVAEGQYLDALEEIRNRQAVLAQRRSELQLARQQLQDTVVRAPIGGAVRERQVTPGEYRAAGTPVLTIVRTHPLRLQVAVPERSIGALRPGLPVRVSVDGDTRTHDGRLARIGAALDEANRTLPVEAVVDNPSGALRPGQFAAADIVVRDDDTAMVVPSDAVVTFAGVQKVLTIREGRAHEQRIRTGRRDGDQVEVVEGLSSGDIVIRSPGDLVDGAPVQARNGE
jgi:RND family efflux transporter MFP subunit